MRKIISGGQTGVDQAALYAARELDIPTGGHMPKGFKTQNGNRTDFALKFGMRETSFRGYEQRTRLNILNSDATLRIAGEWNSPGEILTLKFIEQYCKEYVDVNRCLLNDEFAVRLVVNWIRDNEIKVLNVAGNSERTSPGIFEESREFLIKVFQKIINIPYQMILF